MTMRISKWPPLFGVGLDAHGKLPGAVPPAPAPAPLPTSPWAVIIGVHALDQILTGKWSLQSNLTEGMGDVLWGNDWGPGQVHVPITPHYVTPSLITTLLGSTTKYWLPSFAVKEKCDGAITGSETPVAVSLPCYMILTQQCHDHACAVSFVAPSSLSFQQVSTRWVGFCGGDFLAGLIGMAGDAIGAAIVSKFGGKLIPGNWDNQLMGGLASTFMGFGSGLVGMIPTEWKIATGMAGVGIAHAFGATGALALLGPLAGWAGGELGTAAGNRWGSREGDTGVGEPPPPPPPPPSAGTGGAGGTSGSGGAGGADAGPSSSAPPSAGDSGPSTSPDAPADGPTSSEPPPDGPTSSEPPDDGGTCDPGEPPAGGPTSSAPPPAGGDDGTCDLPAEPTSSEPPPAGPSSSTPPDDGGSCDPGEPPAAGPTSSPPPPAGDDGGTCDPGPADAGAPNQSEPPSSDGGVCEPPQ
jgi:hypothetical protein